jgi:hypothetical protein
MSFAPFRTLAATVAITAEAQSEALELRQLGASASGLPGIVSAVQVATARTAFFADFLREIFVDRQQKRPEAGGGRQIVIHG